MREPWELTWTDYYAALGIEPDAGDAAVHAAFRSLARIYHPDRQQGATDAVRSDAERRFKIIGEAYAVLRDPARRDAYAAAYARAAGGLAPVPRIMVDPDTASMRSFGGDVVVRSHLTLPAGLPQALLSVDCADPYAELRRVVLTPCTHGRDGLTDAAVRVRLHAMRARRLHLEYRIGPHVTAQTLDVRTVPAPLSWPGQLYHRVGGATSLVLAGILIIILSPIASGTGTAAIIAAGAAVAALGLLFPVVALVRTPGWTRRLRRPRVNWMTVVGTLMLASFLIRVLRAVY
jgi:hypothetical protein